MHGDARAEHAQGGPGDGEASGGAADDRQHDAHEEQRGAGQHEGPVQPGAVLPRGDEAAGRGGAAGGLVGGATRGHARQATGATDGPRNAKGPGPSEEVTGSVRFRSGGGTRSPDLTIMSRAL